MTDDGTERGELIDSFRFRKTAGYLSSQDTLGAEVRSVDAVSCDVLQAGTQSARASAACPSPRKRTIRLYA